MNEHSRWARIGLLVSPEDRHGFQYHEALEHTGLAYESLEERSLLDLESHGILLLCGRYTLRPQHIEAIARWVERGGVLVCSGSAWGLEAVLGVDPEKRTAAFERLNPENDSYLWPEEANQIRFIGGDLHTPNGCEIIASVRGSHVGISRRSVGRGWAYFLAPHLGQTMSLMLFGRSVESDGLGPDDGSAFLLDDNWRAEDGTNLDFKLDRSALREEATPFFAFPYVDLLREVLVRAVFEGARMMRLSLALVWYWPRFAPANVLMTFECDQFNPDHVFAMDRMLQMMQCRATWLAGPPGYGNDLYRWLKQRDHEPGLLFLTEDPAGWHEGKLKIQHQMIGRSSSTSDMPAVRPVEGRWYRLNEFYAMAEEAGPRVSVSKGGRQAGTSGFLFGTCHPFYPRRTNGTSYHVLEVPYQVFQPGRRTTDEAAAMLVQEVLRRNGVLQIVSTPEAVSDPVAFSSLRKVLTQCKMNRMEFAVPSEMLEYERLRRNVRIAQVDRAGRGLLRINSPSPFERACILVSEPAVEASRYGMPGHLGIREYLGVRFLSLQADLDAKSANEIDVQFAEDASLSAAA